MGRTTISEDSRAVISVALRQLIRSTFANRHYNYCGSREINRAVLCDAIHALRSIRRQRSKKLMSGNFLLTVDEAASALQCSADHIYRLIQSGELVGIDNKPKPNSKQSYYLVTRASLLAYVNRRKNS